MTILDVRKKILEMLAENYKIQLDSKYDFLLSKINENNYNTVLTIKEHSLLVNTFVIIVKNVSTEQAYTMLVYYNEYTKKFKIIN